MPLNLTDYSQLPVQKPWTDTLFEDALKGYETGRAPKKLKEEQKQRELANALKQQELDNNPAKMDLEKRYKEALINRANTLAQGGGTNVKPSGDVANALFVKQLEAKFGKDDPQAVAAREAYEVNKHAKEVNTDSKSRYASSLAYRNLPNDEKKRAVAITTGMGLDPMEGEKLLSEGKTLKQIAKEKGLELDRVTPVYPVGSENIKQTQRRGAFVNELDKLSNLTKDAQGKYQNKIKGYSFDQIADAISGEDPETQGMILASRAIQPELNALRLKVLGGQVGIEALRELESKSLSNLNVIEGLVDTKAFMAMQKYLNQWIREASEEYNKTLEGYGRISGKPNLANDSAMGEDPLGLF